MPVSPEQKDEQTSPVAPGSAGQIEQFREIAARK
jgi:hypothetical protein